MITNAQPWDNLKFDLEGIGEVQRKFFGTLYNTYSFFALYSNIDGFTYAEKDVPFENRPEIDRWILSELNTLIKNVDNFYAEYEPTKAGREIQHFVDEYLSNWYVRLSRRRFWKGEYSEDKISAYQTLYTCLITLAKLSSPIAPFFADKLFLDLNTVTQREDCPSIHMSEFPTFDESIIDKKLEERMQLAQKISSMVLSLRKKSFMRVRQPLSKIMIPILDQEYKHQIQQVESLILHEVNVKEVQYISESDGILVRNIKPNFKTLGPRFGKLMKQIAAAITEMNQEQISTLERDGNINVMIDGAPQTIELGDVDIFAQDIPGWAVANEGLVTIALDLTLTDELYAEGLARDFVNRIQNIRKEQNFDVTDTIQIFVEQKELVADALLKNISYICSETLADKLEVIKEIEKSVALEIELTDEIVLTISVLRNN
jgi:isoleucyl-tRNA synthetase